MFFVIYRYFVYKEWIAGMWIYLILSCGLMIAYVTVNRGISRKPTPQEDLPDEWDHIKKAEFLEDEKKRRRVSRIIMMFFAAVSITLLVDMTELFFFDYIKEILGYLKNV